MKIFKELSRAKEPLIGNKIGVTPTDTIYGLLGLARKEPVERIYEVKDREPDKPFIILLANQDQLQDFPIEKSSVQSKQLERLWPGPVSIILPLKDKNELDFLHRGKETLAFRVPNFPELQDLIEKTGPLVAPSANPEGKNPAETINQAKEYFGDEVDFYIDQGQITGKSSTLIDFTNEQPQVIREGAFNTENIF